MAPILYILNYHTIIYKDGWLERVDRDISRGVYLFIIEKGYD